MRDRLHQLGDDTAVVLITFTEPKSLAEYSANLDLPFPVLIDADRSCYRAYGLGRGNPARIYGWRAARRYLEILRSDGPGGLRRPSEDTLQLGGDFVVDREGLLRYSFQGNGPDDRPAVDDLIEALEPLS